MQSMPNVLARGGSIQPRAALGRQTPELPQTRPALALKIPATNLTSSHLPTVYFGGTLAINQHNAPATDYK